MRFTGRIRLGDVQEADLDVTVEVSDTHVRLVSGDESLGSWCLADVVANRLLANEFELELGDEVLTFLADDQVNFAYGAVQKMAEGWARYHAMNLVRRKRAVAAARRHNEPNRLETVRRAFVSARDELRKPIVAASPEPEEEPPVVEPAAAEVEPVLVEEQDEAAAPTGAPRFWEKVEQATAAEATDEEEEPGETMPVEEETSVEQEQAPEPVPMTNFAGRLPRLNALPRRPDRENPAAKVAIEEVRATPLEPAPAEVVEEPDRHEPEPEPVIQPPVREEPLEEEERIEARVEVDTTEVEPEPVEEANGHRESPQPAAVGSYRDGHHPSETTGLRASLKSLLSRSKEPHEHSFVEGTTAVGITRKVCLECGHVSIGVSE